jgi:hypothetical protein
MRTDDLQQRAVADVDIGLALNADCSNEVFGWS